MDVLNTVQSRAAAAALLLAGRLLGTISKLMKELHSCATHIVRRAAVNLAVVSSISLKSSGKSKQRKHQQSSLVEVLLYILVHHGQF